MSKTTSSFVKGQNTSETARLSEVKNIFDTGISGSLGQKIELLQQQIASLRDIELSKLVSPLLQTNTFSSLTTPSLAVSSRLLTEAFNGNAFRLQQNDFFGTALIEGVATFDRLTRLPNPNELIIFYAVVFSEGFGTIAEVSEIANQTQPTTFNLIRVEGRKGLKLLNTNQGTTNLATGYVPQFYPGEKNFLSGATKLCALGVLNTGNTVRLSLSFYWGGKTYGANNPYFMSIGDPDIDNISLLFDTNLGLAVKEGDTVTSIGTPNLRRTKTDLALILCQVDIEQTMPTPDTWETKIQYYANGKLNFDETLARKVVDSQNLYVGRIFSSQEDNIWEDDAFVLQEILLWNQILPKDARLKLFVDLVLFADANTADPLKFNINDVG